MKNLARIIAPIALAAELLVCGPNVYSQQSELSVQVDRMGRAEAQNRLDHLVAEISKTDFTDYGKRESIVRELRTIAGKCDDRKIQYTSNLLIAKTMYFRGLSEFPDMFDAFERCVFEYPEQEKSLGFVYDALTKIGPNFVKDKKVIGAIRCNELLQQSTYPNKSSSMKKSLDLLLDTDIFYLTPNANNSPEEVGLRDAVIYLFEKEHVKPQVLYKTPDNKSRFQFFRETRQVVNDKVVQHYFPQGKNPVGYFVEIQIDAPVAENRNLLFSFKNVVMGDSRNIFAEGKWLGEQIIYLKEGTTVREFFEAGGVNPYNCIYKKAVSGGTSSIKNLDW